MYRTSVSRAAIPGSIVSDAVQFRSAQHALVAGLPAEHVQKRLLAASSSRAEGLFSVLPVDHPHISHASASILANPRQFAALRSRVEEGYGRSYSSNSRIRWDGNRKSHIPL